MDTKKFDEQFEKLIADQIKLNQQYAKQLAEIESIKQKLTEVGKDTTNAASLLTKIEGTDYEVKDDGIYWQNKKLDNPENKSPYELVGEDIKKRKKEELELMIEEKAVEINEENFDFRLFGAPGIFDLAESDRTKTRDEKISDINFYQIFYSDNSDKHLILTKKLPGKIIYIYQRDNFISGSNRRGSFLGMSIELDGIYCTDFEKLERLFDKVFEELLIKKYNLLRKNNNPDYPYTFNVDSFESKKVQQDIAEIKDILLKNFKDKFSGDFRKSDENFKKNTQIDKFYNLHKITKEGEDIKPFDPNYFDFDRNAINTKYDKELTNLSNSPITKQESSLPKNETESMGSNLKEKIDAIERRRKEELINKIDLYKNWTRETEVPGQEYENFRNNAIRRLKNFKNSLEESAQMFRKMIEDEKLRKERDHKYKDIIETHKETVLYWEGELTKWNEINSRYDEELKNLKNNK